MAASGQRGKDAVALVALVAAAGWTGWLLARQGLDLDATWTDGERPVPSLATDAVRHAIWDDPRPLEGEVNGGGREGRPAVSPDGRHLVFTVGERGLNAELWIAELLGGRAVDARPLAELNSAGDDLAPAFGPDVLWFASDRGGAEFGLDLWRVAYADGRFEDPEPAGAGINSGADDTDPFPVVDPESGLRSLVFASNRARGAREDFDLYGAVPRAADSPADTTNGATEGDATVRVPAAPGGWLVGALTDLNSPFEEREPALTPDGRALLFASDRSRRPGGADRPGYDLFRSFRSDDAPAGPGSWLPPTPLAGVNTDASERAPLPVDGGFALLFERAVGADPGDILRARSRELFRLPQPPLALRDLLILVVLVSLAVLALLAKRWRAIDVLYKCLLVSVLAHLLLLLWFREVVPEPTPVAASDVERTFRVRLAASTSGPAGSQRELGGELAAERSEGRTAAADPSRTDARVELRDQTAASPAAGAPLRNAARPSEDAPSPRSGLDAVRAGERADVATAVQAPAAEAPVFDSARPEVPLAPSATASAASLERARPSDPGRAGGAELARPAAAAPRPTGTVVATRARGVDAPRAPRRTRASGSEAERPSASTAELALAGPVAPDAPTTSSAPDLAVADLAAPGGERSPPEADPALPGRASGGVRSSPRAFAAEPAASALAAARERATDDGTAGARARLAGPAAVARGGGVGEIALAEPAVPGPAAPTAVAGLPLGELRPQGEVPERSRAGDSAPIRAAGVGPGGAATDGPATRPPDTRLDGLLAEAERPAPPGPAPRGARVGEPSAASRRTTPLQGVDDPFGGETRDETGRGGVPAAEVLDLGALAATPPPERRATEDGVPVRARPGAGTAGAETAATSTARPSDRGAAGLLSKAEPAALPGRGERLDDPSAPARRSTLLQGIDDPYGDEASDGEGRGDLPSSGALDLGNLAVTERNARTAEGGAPVRARAEPLPGTDAARAAPAPASGRTADLLAERAEAGPGPARARDLGRGPVRSEADTRVRLPDAGPDRGDRPRERSGVAEAPPELALGEPAPVARDRDATRGRRSQEGPTRDAGGAPLSAPASGSARPAARPRVAAVPRPDTGDDGPRRERGRTAYSNRFGDARLRALEEFGGGDETEAAVANGLRYLASIQNQDGSWGDRRDFDRSKYRDVRIGKTGLALLAFLGAGHLPEGTTAHAGVSRRALDHLVGLVHARTGHVGDGASYSHAIATYALAEAYAMTTDAPLRERMRAPLERAVARILVAQDQRDDPRLYGGWGYYFGDGSVWNGDRWPRVSVTAWQVMALESARLGGLHVPDEAFAAARTFLARAWDAQREAFRYTHDPARLRSRYEVLPASTPAALFALSLLDVDLETDELAPAWRFLAQRRPRGYDYQDDDAFVFDARGNLYFWYYGSLASFRRGGDTWRRWNVAMLETLLPAQEDDGSWRPISTYADYAGDEDGERTYTTALCVLSLEVYYRYFTPLLRVR